MVRTNRFRFSIVAFIAILIAVQQGAGAAYGRPEAPTGLDPQAYLPLVQSAEPLGIHGYVTDNGAPAANVDLNLRFWNGNAWSTRASTTTETDGRFRFLDIAKLNPGQAYYVRFLNGGTDSSRLAFWFTAELDSYAAGSDVHIGDFDLGDIVFQLPVNGDVVSLPRNFTWQKRVASPTDSYEFNLFDDANTDLWWWTPPLGFVGVYKLESLPDGFDTDYYYLWWMWVYDGSGGVGASYWARWVAFTNTGAPVYEVPGSEFLTRSAVQLDLPAMPIPLDLDRGD